MMAEVEKNETPQTSSSCFSSLIRRINLDKNSYYSMHKNQVAGISCYALGHLLQRSSAQVHTDKLRPQSATSWSPSLAEHMAVAKPSRFGSSRKQFKDRLPSAQLAPHLCSEHAVKLADNQLTQKYLWARRRALWTRWARIKCTYSLAPIAATA